MGVFEDAGAEGPGHVSTGLVSRFDILEICQLYREEVGKGSLGRATAWRLAQRTHVTGAEGGRGNALAIIIIVINIIVAVVIILIIIGIILITKFISSSLFLFVEERYE